MPVRAVHSALPSVPESVMCVLRVWREAHVAVMWGSHGREALAFSITLPKARAGRPGWLPKSTPIYLSHHHCHCQFAMPTSFR